MPVYEFYCSDCHAIFNFLSHRVITDTRPTCPRCGRQDLTKQVSRFVISKNRPEPSAEGLPAGLNEDMLEQARLKVQGLRSRVKGHAKVQKQNAPAEITAGANY